jgi:hypothetical protein
MAWLDEIASVPGWRGVHFWKVMVAGRASLVEMARTWTALDVLDASYQIQLAEIEGG